MVLLQRVALAMGLLGILGVTGVLARARGEDPAAPGAVPSAEVEQAFDVLRRAIGQRLLPPTTAPAAAADGAGKAIYTDDEVLSLLRRVDPQAHIERPGRLWFQLHAQNILVGNEGKAGLQFIHILQGFPGQVEVANRWNVTKRFTSCSIDEDGDWWFEMDVPLWGGVTSHYLTECIDLYQSSLAAYLEELRALLPADAGGADDVPEGPPDNR